MVKLITGNVLGFNKNREESSTHVFCFKIGRQIAEKMGPNAGGGAHNVCVCVLNEICSLRK